MAHDHCDLCVLTACSSRNGCPLKACTECDVRLHACKLDDHLENICPEAVVACINAGLGCPTKLKRRLLLRHFEHCPAWIVSCQFFYKRFQPRYVAQHDLHAFSEPPLLPDEKFLLDDIDFLQRSATDSQNALRGKPPLPLDPSAIYTCSHSYVKSEQRVQCHMYEKGCKVHFIDPNNDVSWHYRWSLAPRPSHVFSCGQFIRRDEFSFHYHNHNDLFDGLSMKIRRCPLHTYGCNHGAVHYQPGPIGSELDYCPEASSFVLRPPQTIMPGSSGKGEYEAALAKKKELAQYGYDDCEGSLDLLGQLPPEVLVKIIELLDSLSLWCLSQVNHYLRSLSQGVARRKGVVHKVWKKDNACWKQGPEVRERETKREREREREGRDVYTSDNISQLLYVHLFLPLFLLTYHHPCIFSLHSHVSTL